MANQAYLVPSTSSCFYARPDTLNLSNQITLQQDSYRAQEKAMGEETSTKLRSSVRTKENGRDRGGNSTPTGSPAPHASSTSTSTISPSSHTTLAYVFLFLLVDLLGFTVILPLIPSLLEYYDNHDEGGLYPYLISKVDSFRSFIGAPETERFNLVLLGGLLGSLFSFLQFFASPLIGASSDILGRKPVLVSTMLGVALSYALWAVSQNFMLFVVARIIGGLSKGNVSLSTAIVTDVTTAEKRSKGMALVGVAFSLGFIFGPMIGAAFSVLGKEGNGSSSTMFQYPALFSLTMATLDILLMVLLFKETLPLERRAKSLGHGISGTLYLINPISLFKYDAVSKIDRKDLSNLRLMSIAYFLYLFLFSGLEYSLTFLVHQRFSYSSMQQGKMFLFIGIIMVLVQGGYLRRRPPGTEKRTALTGILLIIPGMLLVGWASSSYMLYAGLMLYSFGSGTVVPSMTTMVSKYGEGDEKGKVMGIFRSLGALSRALGPFLACTVYWRFSACVCYMVGAVGLSVPLLMLLFITPKLSDKKQ